MSFLEKVRGLARGRTAAPFLCLWAFLLSIEYLILGPYSFVVVHDLGDSFIPLYIGIKDVSLSSLLGGWDSRITGGLDLGSQSISQLKIGQLAMQVLPAWLVFGLFTFIQRAIAGVFMYRIIVDIFNGRRDVAFAAAMLFAVGQDIAGHSMYYGWTYSQGLGIAALPLLFWLYWRWSVARPGLLVLTMFAAGIVIALSSQQTMIWEPCGVFALFLLIANPINHWFRVLPPLLALAAGAALIELPNSINIVADLALAHRIVTPPPPLDEKVEEALRVLGRIPFLLMPAVAAIVFAFVVNGRRAVPFAVSAVTFVFLAGLSVPSLVGWLLPGPGALATFNFIRVLYVLPFLLILMAGIGLSRMGEAAVSSVPRSLIRDGLIVATIVWACGQEAWLKLNSLRYYGHGSNYVVLYENPAFQRVAAVKSDQAPFRVATAEIDGVTHLNKASYPWAYGLETADGYVNVYPRRYQELWLEAVRPAEMRNAPHYEKMRDWGNRLYIPAKAADCSAVRVQDFSNLELLSLLNVRFIASPCPLQDAQLRLFAENREGSGQAWHRQSDIEKFKSMFRGDFPSKELFVYENPAVQPRYFLAGRAVVLPGGNDVLAALGSADRDTLATNAFLAGPDVAGITLPQGAADNPGSVRVVSAADDEIHLEVTAERDAVLVAANSYNPRWTASVNGRDTRVFAADHALQGLVVPAGRSDVVLRYRSAMWRLIDRF